MAAKRQGWALLQGCCCAAFSSPLAWDALEASDAEVGGGLRDREAIRAGAWAGKARELRKGAAASACVWPGGGLSSAEPPFLPAPHLGAGLVNEHVCLGGRQPELCWCGRARSRGGEASRRLREQAARSVKAGQPASQRALPPSPRLFHALVGRHDAGGRLLAAPLQHVSLPQAHRGRQIAHGAGPVRLQAGVEAQPVWGVKCGVRQEQAVGGALARAEGGWRAVGGRPSQPPQLTGPLCR